MKTSFLRVGLLLCWLLPILARGQTSLNGLGVTYHGATLKASPSKLWESNRAEIIAALGAGSGSGDVAGAPSSTNGNLASYSGTTGRQLADSGLHSTNIMTRIEALALLAAKQAASTTLSNLAGLNGSGLTNLNATTAFSSGQVPISRLATGTPDGTKFIRDDGTLAVPPGGGGSGDVVGPASVTDSVLALFNGTTGKLIKAGSLTEAAINANLTESEASALYQATNSILTQLKALNGAGLTNLNASIAFSSGTVPIARLATGTPDGTKFIRDDGTLAVPSGGGDVVGPASATDSVIALYNGTTGKLLKNGSLTEAAINANLTEAEASALYQATNSILTQLKALNGAGLTNLNASIAFSSGTIPIARLASGTPDGTKFIRDDGTLATPAGGGSGNASTNVAQAWSAVQRFLTNVVFDGDVTMGVVYADAVISATPTTVSKGGTDATNAAQARINLGLEKGVVGGVQDFNARLADLAALSYALGDLVYYNGTNLVRLPTSSNVRSILGAADYAAIRTLLSVLPSSGGTFSGAINIPANAYGGSWSGSTKAATEGDVYAKIQTVVSGGLFTEIDTNDLETVTSGTNVTLKVKGTGTGSLVRQSAAGSGSGTLLRAIFDRSAPSMWVRTNPAVAATDFLLGDGRRVKWFAASTNQEALADGVIPYGAELNGGLKITLTVCSTNTLGSNIVFGVALANDLAEPLTYNTEQLVTNGLPGAANVWTNLLVNYTDLAGITNLSKVVLKIRRVKTSASDTEVGSVAVQRASLDILDSNVRTSWRDIGFWLATAMWSGTNYTVAATDQLIGEGKRVKWFSGLTNYVTYADGVIPAGQSLAGGVNVTLHFISTNTAGSNVVWQVEIAKDGADPLTYNTALLLTNALPGAVAVTNVSGALTDFTGITNNTPVVWRITRLKTSASDTESGFVGLRSMYVQTR